MYSFLFLLSKHYWIRNIENNQYIYHCHAHNSFVNQLILPLPLSLSYLLHRFYHQHFLNWDREEESKQTTNFNSWFYHKKYTGVWNNSSPPPYLSMTFNTYVLNESQFSIIYEVIGWWTWYMSCVYIYISNVLIACDKI